jgi:CRP/FNR family transcriptional regulator
MNLTHAHSSLSSFFWPATAPPPKVQPKRIDEPSHVHAQRVTDLLRLMEKYIPIRRRMLHYGDAVYQAGEEFANLYIIHSGQFKVINLSSDGRGQIVALRYKGDWLGFDGISSGCHGCDVIAMDTGEVWSIRYQTLVNAGSDHTPLLCALHGAMSLEIARDRDFLMSLCTLSVDARVADFLHQWVSALAQRGQHTDQITLRMTRAEIGNHLGMTLESVSRALSRLAREEVIQFSGKGRRDLQIPDAEALARFVQRTLASGEQAM